MTTNQKIEALKAIAALISATNTGGGFVTISAKPLKALEAKIVDLVKSLR